MWTFLHDNFDKLLIFFLIVIVLMLQVAVKTGGDVYVRTLDNLTGALIAIITGKLLSKNQSL